MTAPDAGGKIALHDERVPGAVMTQKTSKLLIEDVGGVRVLGFLENSIIDTSQISEISAEVNALIDRDNARKLIFDFAQVRYLSSQSLAMMITLQKKLGACGGTMRLAGVRGELRQVFKITKLDTLFTFHPTVNDALAELGAG